jgi:hypothetical protein
MDTSSNIIVQLTEKLNRIKQQHNAKVKKYLDNHPEKREYINKRTTANYYKRKLKDDVFYNSLEDDDDKLAYVKYLKELLKTGEFE